MPKPIEPRLSPSFLAMFAVLRERAQIWVVGGWVRDWLRGVEPHDADFCTDALPEAIAQAAAQAGVKIILDQVAALHGTYRLTADGQVIDLARLRKDVSRHGPRHAVVQFTDDLALDLARRDLTINALALPYAPQAPAKSPAGKSPAPALVDLHGGEKDLREGLLRLIGAPQERLQEDPLRLLRIARFACMDAGWRVDGATAEAMGQQAQLVKTVSTERRLEELLRALALPRPERFWQLVEGAGACAALLPEEAGPALRLKAQGFLAQAAPYVAAPLQRWCWFLLGGLMATKKEPTTPAPELHLLRERNRMALQWMAPLRFAKRWQETTTLLLAAFAEPNMRLTDEAVVRWALDLGAVGREQLANMFVPAKSPLAAVQGPAKKAWQRAEKLRAGRALWQSQDLNLDAKKLFDTLEVEEGAMRRWMLHELLVHVWLHPKDNAAKALQAVATTLR